MKILYLCNYYPNYLQYFQAKHQVNFPKATYKQVMQWLSEDHFSIFDAYTYHTILQGHEAQLIIANFEPLQRKWLAENKIQHSPTADLLNIALEQIKNYQPNVLFVGSCFNLFGEFLNRARPYCQLIVTNISCPIPKQLDTSQIDLLFTSVNNHLKYFNQKGIPSYYILPGFDTRVLNKLPTTPNLSIDFSFIGGIVPQYHHRRQQLLNQLTKNTPLEIWGYYNKRGKLMTFLNRLLQKNKSLLSRHQGEIWGIEMFRTLKTSRITLNIHGEIADNHTVNMRVFEATGVGTVLLTEQGKNLKDLFQDEQEVISYNSIEEVVEQVNYLLQNPNIRDNIAKAGQQRTLKNYTYQNILKQVLDVINAHI